MSKQPRAAIHKPDLYRKLSEPFPSPDAANEAIKAFHDDLRAIREKHKVRDIAIVLSGSCIYGDGAEHDFMLDAHLGDSSRAETMMAWGLGMAQAERQQVVARTMAAAAPLFQQKGDK